MATNGFKVLDSDIHVIEPGDLWLRYLEPKYRDRAPKATNEYFMDLRLEHAGKVISRSQAQFADDGDMYTELAIRHGRLDEFKAFARRGWGPDTQLEAMDVEGIDVAVSFPSMGLSPTPRNTTTATWPRPFPGRTTTGWRSSVGPTTAGCTARQ